MQRTPPQDPRFAIPKGGEPARVLDRKVALSRWALFFERLWPRIWLPAGVVGLFLAISLFGVWQMLPLAAHIGLLSTFGLLLLAAFIPMARTPWPDRNAALRRIEKKSGIGHRPASSYEDTLTASADDPVTKSLWAAHRDRLLKLLGRMEVGGPHPRTDRLDPFAVRGLMALALGLMFAFAGERTYDRLAAPFRLGPTNEQLLARLDAWVTPPLYTGKAPIMLADGGKLAGQGGASDGHAARILEVPQGSQMVLRAAGDGHERYRVEIRRDGQPTEKLTALGTALPGSDGKAVPTTPAAAAAQANVSEFRYEVKKDVIVKVFNGSRELVSWAFSVIPDHPPKIALTKEPETTPRGALRLEYKAEDDYGVVSAEARFARVEPEVQPTVDAEGKTIQRRPRAPLERPPRFELRLPKSDGKVIEGKAFHDLAGHPWAGVLVKMWLEARDQAGQTGKSEPVEMSLPERRFTKALARAVVEQRRDLAVDARANRDHVIMALDLLTMAPELFIDDRSVYLGLRSAHWRLTHDATRAAARSVMEQLWHIALRIEDGTLSEAERALREAQEKLSKAIEEGASDEEIQKLMQELRQAMAQFLDALSKQAQNRGEPDPQGGENERMVSRRDLDEMLRNIEQMARNGARDQAQQMLSELRDMMEQLQSGRMANRGQNGQGNQMMQMMDQFGDMIQKQQGLLDDTHQQQGAQEEGQEGQDGQQGNGPRQQRRGQQGQQGQGQQGQQGQGQQGQRGQRGQRGQGQQGQQGEQGDQPGGNQAGQGPGQLRDRQGQLRNRLGQMMDSMQGMGLQPSDQLGRAQEAMREAERALGEGDLGRAAEQESRALDQLRQGAAQMAEQMMKGMRQGRTGRNASNMDPLGRPQSTTGPDPGLSVKVPDQIDAQRAREILEELRRRLGETTRPPMELEYLERLLRRF